jgi:outer membrane protein assembly factor BamB
VRHFLLLAVLGTLLTSSGQLPAALNDEIITEAAAQRYGLTRMWVTQAQVDRGQSRLQSVILCDGTIYAQSSRATLEAIDAETGQKLWTKLIGQPSHPTLAPTACGDLVAAINGSTLFVLNRYTGDILYQKLIDGAPGGGPALSTKRVYVPLVTGMIEAYRLEPITDPTKELGKLNLRAADMSDDEKKEAAKQAEEERRENIRIRQDYIPPLACSSTGRALMAPVVTVQNRDEEFVTWGTDRGYLYVGRIDRRGENAFQARYRLNSNGIFSSPPAYLPPDPKVVGDSGMIYGGSTDGYVYALAERSGDLMWKFGMSEPVVDSPVVIEDRVYVTTELGGLFCLNAKTGKQIWWAPEIVHFVAAGKQRIYAADKLGRLRILDYRNGALLDIIPTSTMTIKVSNGQTDRIYLAAEGGTIQCLREVEQTTPVAYNESRKPLPEVDQPKPLINKAKSSASASAKPKERPAAKKSAKAEDAFGSDTVAPAEKPAKPAKGKAAGAAKATGAAKAPAKGNDVENPFGN